MLDNTSILFRDFDQFIKFLVVRREDVTKVVYAPLGFRRLTNFARPILPMQKAIDIKSMTDQKQMEKLDKLSGLMVKLMTEEFTGHIKINFSQGGIGRVEKFEEILKS